jgi:rod shape determining protein RodA
MVSTLLDSSREDASRRDWQHILHLDAALMFGLVALSTLGLFVLYSSAGGDDQLVLRQCIRLGIAFGAMAVVAQLPGSRLLIAGALIVVPVLLIARQPDLGTSLLIGCAGFFALFLAGLSWKLLGGLAVLSAAGAPVLWHFMHDYQRQRVITFLNPEQDPLGAGYHIIQSKIAIGSGGLFGKGWLNGTQAHLEFLPERSTDFIFAVLGEEFGLFGIGILLVMYSFIIIRSLYIATQAQDTYSRLLGGSLAMTFFIYIIVNTGMVTGLLPVVGLPLPLVSYGGTSMVTLMAGFGILMSIQTHRKLLPT